MTERTALLAELAAHVEALTETTVHHQQRWTWDSNRNRKALPSWATVQPSLLDQLTAAVVPGETHPGPGTHARVAPRSTPPARLDAIDRHRAISIAVARWCERLGVARRHDLAVNIRTLAAAGHTADIEVLRGLCAQARSWRYWAATVVGWLTPPWRPIAPCPLCGVRGVLRVRLDVRTACCMSCGQAWGPERIEQLAATVRTYRETSRASALAARSRQHRQTDEEKSRYPLTLTVGDLR